MKEACFLDKKLCEELREAINSSPIFINDDRFKNLYNLICAAMDRLDTCVEYLNSHSSYPDSENDFMCFLMFACMLRDGVKNLLENVSKQKSEFCEEKKYFKKYCMSYPINFTEKECPTDDKFFEYFRSLSFAHPYETNRNKNFFDKFGKQVSPWVSVNKMALPIYKFDEPIGVKVYSSKKDENGSDTQYIMFSFHDLKAYLISRYNELYKVTEWAKTSIENIKKEWEQTKVDRNQEPLSVLKNIRDIYIQRFQEVYDLNDLISYMECELSDEKNRNCVNQYREYVFSQLDSFCDAVDELDYDKQADIELSLISFNLINMHQGYCYQTEKIYSYLSEECEIIEPGSNVEWGLIQADAFYRDFAHKWVKIDTDKMSFTEIKLLVTTACYLEEKEQRGK